MFICHIVAAFATFQGVTYVSKNISKKIINLGSQNCFLNEKRTFFEGPVL